MKNTESKIKLWGERISAWETSGENMRKFCLKRSIAPSTFRRWKKILRKNVLSKKALFTEIKSKNGPNESSSKVEISYKGMKITLSEDFSISTLQKITKAFTC